MIQTSSNEQSWFQALLVALAAVAGIAFIGGVDYLTGVEYRIFAFYYLPLSLAAWHLGRVGALTAAALCAVSWLASNYLGGLRYSGPTVWVVNFSMQSASFVLVGILVATVRRAFLRAHRLSQTDSMTGLLNSRAFSDETARTLALAHRYHRPVTLAYVDLDNFKTVNDTLGHHAGDALLRATADLLRDSIRAGDIAARMGGDEFVVLLPETGPEGARILVERLRASLATVLGRAPLAVTASVGAVCSLEPPATAEELIRQADATMYSAKVAGKDCMRFVVVGSSTGAGGVPTMPVETP